MGPGRFVSEPAALGLAAFGLTTMVLTPINAGILSSKILPMVGALALGVQAVFITLLPTYALLGLGDTLPSNALFQIGGAFGIATAACAWYVSAAIVFNRTFRRDVLPLFETRSVRQDVGP